MSAKPLNKKKTKTDYLQIGKDLHEGRKGKPAGNDTKTVTGIVASFASDASSYSANRDSIVEEIERILRISPQDARITADQRAKPLGFKSAKSRNKKTGKGGGLSGWVADFRSLQDGLRNMKDLSEADEILWETNADAFLSILQLDFTVHAKSPKAERRPSISELIARSESGD